MAGQIASRGAILLRCLLRGSTMNLPKIDIDALPDLDTLTGLFGTLTDAARVQSSDDTIVILMTFLYDLNPTQGMF